MSDIAGLIEQARASVDAAKADPAKTPSSERYELERVAQQFEAMLLTQMLREMRKAGEVDKESGEDGGGMGLGLGTESFTEAIDSELGLYLAKNKGIGLTSQLMQAFDRMNVGRVETALAGSADTAGSKDPAYVQSAAVPAYGESVTSRVQSLDPADVKDVVTSEFGWRRDPFTGQAKFHKGIDLRAAYGEDVQAAAAGTVVFSGEQGGYGTTVVVEHADGSRSRYAHLSAATVEPGSVVAAGQAVGRAGRSGRATGTHLHFEVTGPEGQPISPSQWMQRWAGTNED